MENKNCIICNKNKFVIAFPFNTNFNGKLFHYYKCLNCKFVTIEPNPSKKDFSKLYKNNLYHKKFYSSVETKDYKESVKYIKNLLKNKAKFLDFGCGDGNFIEEIKDIYESYGVEFDLKTIEKCKRKIINASFLNNIEIASKKYNNYFDAIHLGDVLEHVTNPKMLLFILNKKIKKKGFLYIEGPLERNVSLINYSIIFFGNIKRLFRSSVKNNFKPYHLYFCNFKNQISMINILKKYIIVKCQIYETGWPYNEGRFIKKFIAMMGIIFAKLNIFGFRFGNRLRIILQKHE